MFIYLLYSLLATVITEIIATQLGLRSRNLKEAINRMLTDEENSGKLRRLWDSMRLIKNPKNRIITNFYDHPEIKYLGSTGIFKTPSSFKAVSFSKTLMCVLFGDGAITAEQIDAKWKVIIKNAKNAPDPTPTDPEEEIEDPFKMGKNEKILDYESGKYIRSLWEESSGNIQDFRLHLEAWFNRTMDEATEWYKRKIQIVAFLVGFFISWIFYVDTFSIVSILSTDKQARDQMVSMANSYIENNKMDDINTRIDSANAKTDSQKLNSFLEVKQVLEADIDNANNILGMGAWLPDTVTVIKNKSGIGYFPRIDNFICKNKIPVNGKITFSGYDKWKYFFGLLYHHFWGFFITAIALSLGAPFWFDLLNKVMKLRTSKKEAT
ncbi:MAG: hypothetical protein A2066_19500 [Bacteroidetes bacterium GWB2_41_8]|nr:MAG: hypothetical protein A2066_19500 [Bacteroidetes bacterium GWB2_41_8]